MYIRAGGTAQSGYSRKAYVDLTVGIMVDDGTTTGTEAPNKKYTVEIPVPAGEVTATQT
jgi:hypothetical protein